MKKAISVLLSLVMLVGSITGIGMTAQAAQQENKTLSYKYEYETKTLYVSGKGAIPNGYLGWSGFEDDEYWEKYLWMKDHTQYEIHWFDDGDGSFEDDYTEYDIYYRGLYPDYYMDVTRYVKKLVIGEGITSIGSAAFGYAFPQLEKISLPSTLKTIKHEAFANRNTLKSVVIPANVEEMYARAFECENIVFKGTKTKLVDVERQPDDTPMTYSSVYYCTKNANVLDFCKKNSCKYQIVKTPSKVSGLKVKAGGNSASLSWSKAKNANQYQVQRYVPSKKKWITVATVKTNQYTVKNLSGSTNYKFRVRGVNNVYGGKFSGSYSKSVSAKTKLGKVSGVKLSSKSGKLTVKWSKEKEAKDYQVYYATKKDGSYKKLTTTSKTSCTKKLSKGKTYYVKVRARKKNASGKYTYGAFSQVKRITIK